MAIRHVEEMPVIDSDETWAWEFCDPGPMLQKMLDAHPELASMYARTMAAQPPTVEAPWSIVVAYDEFIPGNKMNVDFPRKAMVCSFSFKELGQQSLTDGQFWITAVVIRSTSIAKIQGGWPHCLRRFLHRLLLGPQGFLTAGFPLVVEGRPVLLFAKLHALLSDGEGLAKGLDWKGHASLKPCLRHFNVFKKEPL